MPHLEVISGGKLAAVESSAAPTGKGMAEAELMIALYVESMLIELEAVARLVRIEELAHSLSLVRQEARELVRRLDQPV